MFGIGFALAGNVLESHTLEESMFLLTEQKELCKPG